MLLVAALQLQGIRRWVWVCHALALLIIGSTSVIRVIAYAQATPPPTHLLDALYPLAYACALLGIALYLPQRSLWVGSTLQLVLDNIATGFAMLVLLQSLLPVLIVSWPWTDQAVIATRYLAFDIAIFYTLGILCRRYHQGGPLIGLAFLSVLCLVLADMLFLLLAWAPNGAYWHFVVAPLYSLQAILLALGAYRSVQNPPKLTVPSNGLMPIDEWLLWVLVPRALLLIVIAIVMSSIVTPPRETLAIVLIISLARELLAAHDLRRAQTAQHRAQLQAQAAAQQTERFLASILHDVAAPLQGAQSAAVRLDVTADPLARIVWTHLEHLGRLFHQLQLYFQARTVPLHVVPVDLMPICDAALDAAQAYAIARQLALRFIVDTDHTHVWADATAVRRIMDNLLTNALKVTPPGSSVIISVSTAPTSTTVRIEVCDSGPGIAPEDQARIFEPLVRLQSGSGLGLGLAIVRETVRELRGSCGVVSQPGAGSTFWVCLPRAKTPDHSEYSAPERAGEVLS